MQKIVLAGGTGFLGQALTDHFVRAGGEVVILSRRPAPPSTRVRTVAWDGRTAGNWATELEGAAAVVNLAGRSIACVHTPEHRREILASRLDAVHAIAAACRQCRQPPPALIQASATGIYGDAGEHLCDEATPAGTGFLAEVCTAWEAAFLANGAAVAPRRVVLRIGFVLGRDGGALPPLVRLTRCFLGGSAGDGRHYLSWIHLEDFCAMVRWAVENPRATGVYNATGPAPVTNRDFMRTLRQVLGRPWSPPAPAWAVKLGARFILRVDPSLALTGQRCMPRRLAAEGFVPKHPDLAATLRGLLSA